MPDIYNYPGYGLAIESFTDADGTALATHSAGWTIRAGNLDIHSNGLSSNNGIGDLNYALWAGQDIGLDQYARARIVAVSTDFSLRLIVHGSLTADTFLCVSANSTQTIVVKRIAGIQTIYDFSSPPLAVNDLVEVRIVRNVLSVYVNGQLFKGLAGNPYYFPEVPSGYPGIGIDNQTATALADNFTAGDLQNDVQSQDTTISTQYLTAGDPSLSVPNLITFTAPTVPAVNLTMPVSENVITLSAPTVPAVNLTMPVSTNTITLSAPAQSELHAITLAAGTNTITLSAPAQSQSMVITLAAGTNTITLSAPAQSQVVAITLDAGSNTITLSAPAQSQTMATTLTAGASTVTISAPTVPALNLTMPVTTCTVTLTAPTQSEVHAITLAAGSNTITLTAPTQSELHAIALAAGSNTIVLSAPIQSQSAEVTLVATSNVITLSAPAPILGFDQTLLAGANTLASITAPDATLLVGVQYDGSGNITFTFAPAPALTVTAPIAELVEQGKLTAGPNTITITAPIATVPVTLAAVANLLTVSAPDATLLVGVQFYENWLLQSENLDAAYPPWNPQAVSVVPNAALAPDGTMTAMKLVDADYFGLSVGHYILGTLISTMPDVTTAVFSAYLKAAEYDTVSLSFYDDAPSTGFGWADYVLTGSGSASVNYDEGFDGVDGVRQAAGIQNVGGGWYRCWLSIGMLLAGSSHFEISIQDASHIADVTKGLYAWGAQVNRDSISPSPYLKSGSEVLSSTVFTFAPAPALTITAPVALFLDLDQLIIADASHITFEAPLAILSKRMGVLKVRAVARITVRKTHTAALVTRTTPYEAPVAALKAQSTLLMVSEPLDAKLGLVVSSSEIVVG